MLSCIIRVRELERERAAAESRMNQHLEELGFVGTTS